MEEARGDAGLIARIWRGATRAEDGRFLVNRELTVEHHEVAAAKGLTRA